MKSALDSLIERLAAGAMGPSTVANCDASSQGQPQATAEPTPRPGTGRGKASSPSQPTFSNEPAGLELPTRRCRACNSWLFWESVHGTVVCATCHPPASRTLVKTWYWLPEGECKKTQ